MEQMYPDPPAGPGRVLGSEYESIRHGATCLTASPEVWCGWIIAPTPGPSRTVADFVTHGEQTVATDPGAASISLADNLNSQQSGSLVLWVTQARGIAEDLGKKGKRGLLKAQESRAVFISDESQRIRFVSTPKPTSRPNQIKKQSIILMRKLLHRSEFHSVEDLKARILVFIESFNLTMAKSIRRLDSGSRSWPTRPVRLLPPYI